MKSTVCSKTITIIKCDVSNEDLKIPRLGQKIWIQCWLTNDSQKKAQKANEVEKKIKPFENAIKIVRGQAAKTTKCLLTMPPFALILIFRWLLV